MTLSKASLSLIIKCGDLMKKDLITGTSIFFISAFLSIYILVKVGIYETSSNLIYVLALSIFAVTFIHMLTAAFLKKNIAWNISKATIIPEIIMTGILYIWRPSIAIVESILIVIVTFYICHAIFKVKNKTKMQITGKRVLRCVNVNCVLHSLILVPGVVIMIPYLVGNKPIIIIPSNNITTSTECTIPYNEWASMTISEKTDFVEDFIEHSSSSLLMDTSPNVHISYLPSGLCGSYSREDDCLLLNSTILKEDDLKQLINTLSHEMYHRFEYFLVEDYFNGHLDNNYLTNTMIDKIEIYKLELENYKSVGISEESYDNYYNQVCESDARAFAEKIVNTYF